MYDVSVREKERRTRAAPRAWHELTESLLRGLEREARTSPDREVYRELVRRPGGRLGLTAVLRGSGKVAFTVEVLVDRSACTAAIEGALALRGYPSMWLDNDWIAYEREVPRPRLAAEWQFLRGVIEAREQGQSAERTMEGGR